MTVLHRGAKLHSGTNGARFPGTVWLVVPVKPWAEAKSRLRDTLTADERAKLSRTMLAGVLDAARRSAALAGVVVISRDAEVLALAEAHGATALPEVDAGLNEALEQARRYVIERGAEALLVLPSDLPLVTPEEICALVEAGQGAQVVIAPSRDDGTNALLLQPPDVLRFEFGAQSFRRHRDQAEERGLTCAVMRSERLALDVDWPEDLVALTSAEMDRGG